LSVAQKQERWRALWCFFSLFLLLTAYYLVKPLRSSFFLKEFDPATLPYFFLCFPFLSLAVTRAFDFFYARLPRLRLIVYTYGLVMACKLFFWFALPLGGKVIILAFYLWSSVYFLLCIAVLWACISSVFNAGAGERWFAFIAFGGMAGAYVGSELSGYLAKSPWANQALGISAVLMAGVLGFLFLALRHEAPPKAEPPKAESAMEPSSIPQNLHRRQSVVADLGAIWQRPFIRGLAVIVFAVAFMNTVVEFKTQKIIDRQLAETQYLKSFGLLNQSLCNTAQNCKSTGAHPAAFEQIYTLKQWNENEREGVLKQWMSTQPLESSLQNQAYPQYLAYSQSLEQNTRRFFSDMNKWINLIGVFLLLGVARPLFRWIGLRWVVLILPLGFMVTVLALLFPLELSMVSALLVATGTLNYSLNKTSKELLYTAADEEVRFRFKPLIDGPLVRFGDVAAALLTLLVTKALELSHTLQDTLVLSVGLVLCLFWAISAYRSGRVYDDLKGGASGEVPV
jgi:ATP/ADP translocase